MRPSHRIAKLTRVLALAGGMFAGLPRSAPAQHAAPPTDLQIHFLEVGQADAILITLGRLAVLVDAGAADDIVQVLADYGIDSLVAAIASHNHDDHIGGMDAVIADMPIGRYLANGRPPETASARNVEWWLEQRRVPHPDPPWDPIQLGDTRLTVFRTALESATENNASLAVLLERGRFRALLTGDSEVEELQGWLGAGLIPDVDVLKAAHHGARNGVTPGWLDRTKPEVVVISVGANNAYGHPDPWALRYYRAHGRRIYRTDLDGTITVRVDREGHYQVTAAGPVMR